MQKTLAKFYPYHYLKKPRNKVYTVTNNSLSTDQFNIREKLPKIIL
jgi:hypothetical protein